MLKAVPAPLIPNVPTLAIVTPTPAGGQPFVSAYVTENVKVVAVVPLAGETPPELRSGSCAGPEHAPLAPLVAEGASRIAMIARVSARRRAMNVPPGRVG